MNLPAAHLFLGTFHCPVWLPKDSSRDDLSHLRMAQRLPIVYLFHLISPVSKPTFFVGTICRNTVYMLNQSKSSNLSLWFGMGPPFWTKRNYPFESDCGMDFGTWSSLDRLQPMDIFSCLVHGDWVNSPKVTLPLTDAWHAIKWFLVDNPL